MFSSVSVWLLMAVSLVAGAYLLVQVIKAFSRSALSSPPVTHRAFRPSWKVPVSSANQHLFEYIGHLAHVIEAIPCEGRGRILCQQGEAVEINAIARERFLIEAGTQVRICGLTQDAVIVTTEVEINFRNQRLN
jgi:membrane protein implicated in regulation of membrane protease activity